MAGDGRDTDTRRRGSTRRSRRRDGRSLWATVLWEGDRSYDEQDWRCEQVSQQLLCGRSDDSEPDFALEDEAISREHCRFFLDHDGDYFVKDLGSTNGTYLNGVPVSKARVGVVQDVIKIGDSLLLLDDSELAPGWMTEGVRTEESNGQIGGAMVTLRRSIDSNEVVLLFGDKGVGKSTLLHRVRRELEGNCRFTLMEPVKWQQRLVLSPSPEGARDAHIVERIGPLLGDNVKEDLLDLVTAHQSVSPNGPALWLSLDVESIPHWYAAKTLRQLLGVSTIEIPSLKDRKEDVAAAICKIAQEFNDGSNCVLDADFLEAALLHGWKGGFRELERRIRAALMAASLEDRCATPDDLESSVVSLVGSPKKPSRLELESILKESDYHITRAARKLGCERKQLYRWMAKLGIPKKGSQTPEHE
jgi:hypothetical protein